MCNEHGPILFCDGEEQYLLTVNGNKISQSEWPPTPPRALDLVVCAHVVRALLEAGEPVVAAKLALAARLLVRRGVAR